MKNQFKSLTYDEIINKGRELLKEYKAYKTFHQKMMYHKILFDMHDAILDLKLKEKESVNDGRWIVHVDEEIIKEKIDALKKQVETCIAEYRPKLLTQDYTKLTQIHI